MTRIDHVYIHIPFCHRICPYCSFHKHRAESINLDDFVDAVLLELDERKADFEVIPKTVYVGGGTPTFLNTRKLGRLLTGLADRVDCTQTAEWTVEANPKTVSASKAHMMCARGVTRVSLGAQSWSPEELELLGRDHSPEDAVAAFRTLRNVGIKSINLDLMFSLPSQRLEAWRDTLESVILLKPDHVSAYNLTYEEDTEFMLRFRSGDLTACENRDADLFLAARALLISSGYRHYEISNYAIDGHESLHNKAYWMGADFLGLGPSAVSTVRGHRWANVANTDTYISRSKSGQSPIASWESLSASDRRNEAIALQLRTSQGVDIIHLASKNTETVQRLRDRGMARVEGQKLCLTDTGLPYVDTIASSLFS
ncbi:MAG: radical SAM family heme chaperone HemW [Verrucomicrobiota bacterium]